MQDQQSSPQSSYNSNGSHTSTEQSKNKQQKAKVQNSKATQMILKLPPETIVEVTEETESKWGNSLSEDQKQNKSRFALQRISTADTTQSPQPGMNQGLKEPVQFPSPRLDNPLGSPKINPDDLQSNRGLTNNNKIVSSRSRLEKAKQPRQQLPNFPSPRNIDQFFKKQTQTRSKLRFHCYKIIELSIVLITAIIAFMLDNAINRGFESIAVGIYITKSLVLAPIVDIQLVEDHHQGCNNIEYELLQIGQWPGTFVGCVKDIQKKLGYFYNDALIATSQNSTSPSSSQNSGSSSQQNPLNHGNKDPKHGYFYINFNENQCINKQFKPVDLHSWKGFNVCVKRLHFYEYMKADQSQCKPGLMLCNQNICIPEGEECPLTSIIFKQNATNSNEQITKLSQDNKQPISIIDFSLVNLPCYSSPLRWQYSALVPYPTFQEDEIAYGCKYGIDEQASIIDEEKEANVYIDNNMTKIINQIPSYYSLIKLQKSFLTTRPQIKLLPSIECDREGLNHDLIEDNTILSGYRKIYRTKNLTNILKIVLSIPLILLVLLMLNSMNKKLKGLYKGALCVVILSLLGVIVTGVTVKAMLYMQSLSSFQKVVKLDFSGLIKLAENGCFQDQNLYDAIFEIRQIQGKYIEAYYLLFTSSMGLILSIAIIIRRLLPDFKDIFIKRPLISPRSPREKHKELNEES